MTTQTTKEINEGINGSGQKIWIVFTLKDGNVIWMEKFDNKSEAESWVKWA